MIKKHIISIILKLTLFISIYVKYKNILIADTPLIMSIIGLIATILAITCVYNISVLISYAEYYSANTYEMKYYIIWMHFDRFNSFYNMAPNKYDNQISLYSRYDVDENDFEKRSVIIYFNNIIDWLEYCSFKSSLKVQKRKKQSIKSEELYKNAVAKDIEIFNKKYKEEIIKNLEIDCSNKIELILEPDNNTKNKIYQSNFIIYSDKWNYISTCGAYSYIVYDKNFLSPNEYRNIQLSANLFNGDGISLAEFEKIYKYKIINKSIILYATSQLMKDIEISIIMKLGDDSNAKEKSTN